jgi:hypothetical protein
LLAETQLLRRYTTCTVSKGAIQNNRVRRTVSFETLRSSGTRQRGQGGDLNMNFDDMVKKIDTKALKAEAKKRGIKTGCVKKADIARQLPPDVLEKLASK